MRILIVEDERSIANRLERLLKEILEDQITSLEMRESATAAMDFIQHQEIDILFHKNNFRLRNPYNLDRSYPNSGLEQF